MEACTLTNWKKTHQVQVDIGLQAWPQRSQSKIQGATSGVWLRPTVQNRLPNHLLTCS